MDDDESVGMHGDRAISLHADEAFVAQMRRRRALLELSQGELAARVSALGENLYQQTIAKIESGKRALKLSEADAIAHALGSTVHEMLSATYVDPLWANERISRNTEDLREAVDEALAALHQAKEAEEVIAAQLKSTIEVAREANARVAVEQHSLLVARERLSALQDRYQHYVTQLAAWREVEEATGRPHRPRKRGEGFVPMEEAKNHERGEQE